MIIYYILVKQKYDTELENVTEFKDQFSMLETFDLIKGKSHNPDIQCSFKVKLKNFQYNSLKNIILKN